MLDRSWAMLSCRSRESRARSVATPVRNCASASSPWASRSSSTSCCRSVASRSRLRYASTANTAIATGPTTTVGSNPSAIRLHPMTTVATSTAMTPHAHRNGSVRSTTNASATAHQENDGASRFSGTHVATRSSAQPGARDEPLRTATTTTA